MKDNNTLPRRTFLRQTAAGMGLAALASLSHAQSPARRGQPGAIQPHLPVKAKRVIWLYMAGGMSHLESYDYKPRLAAMNGQPMPTSFTAGQPIAQLQNNNALRCLGPQHEFRRFGQSGQQISEIFPHIGSIADDICIVRSLKTDAINHDPAHTFMNTGTTISGRPSMGSWLSYGLGCEADDLPAFCVLTSSGRFGQSQPIAQRQWHSGFLPSRYQGIHMRGTGDPILYLSNPQGIDPQRQRDVVDAVQQLNRIQDGIVDDPEVATRISQYEMAFRMQSSIPSLRDFSQESQRTLDAYGIRGADGSFGANCLMARRLAERGVRFIQLYHRDWDHHGGVRDGMRGSAGEVDQATAALVKDLKARGMLEDTLIVFGSEFGRTPMAQGNGRDHHMKGFSVWLAGGGIKPGFHYGATDELGYNAAENIVTVHDLHATMLHLLGIDHLRLTYRFQSRDFRLTDVSGEVVREILA